MKRLLLMVLGLACAMSVNAQTDSDGGGVRMTQGLDPLYARLELHTDVIKQEACSGDGLRFTLRFNYTNKGKNVVILDKRSSVIPRYMISRSLKNAIKEKYQIEGHRFIGLDAAGMTDDAVPDESTFAVLKPGEAYSLIRVLTSGIAGDDNSRPLRGLNFLQVVVLTWYYPRASNTKWRNQWQTKGYLWSDPITSIPMPFVVEKNPPIVDCR